jgi:hypothetical protein
MPNPSFCSYESIVVTGAAVVSLSSLDPGLNLSNVTTPYNTVNGTYVAFATAAPGGDMSKRYTLFTRDGLNSYPRIVAGSAYSIWNLSVKTESVPSGLACYQTTQTLPVSSNPCPVGLWSPIPASLATWSTDFDTAVGSVINGCISYGSPEPNQANSRDNKYTIAPKLIITETDVVISPGELGEDRFKRLYTLGYV